MARTRAGGQGLSWGYNWSGPLALAILLGLLLDDINAAAPRGHRYPKSPGLLAGTQKTWRTGCTLTRADLEPHGETADVAGPGHPW